MKLMGKDLKSIQYAKNEVLSYFKKNSLKNEVLWSFC